MPLIFNGNSIPGSGAVIENGVSLSSLKANNVEVWKKQATIYPGAPVAKTQNLGNRSIIPRTGKEKSLENGARKV